MAGNRPLLDNVRLWDWKPFHDTITQLQALRTYYAFHDTDVDRYTIDGQYKQVLLSPRELDISQLPDARANWINPAFIYTHGYGAGAVGSQQDDLGRTAGADDRQRPAGDQNQKPAS